VEAMRARGAGDGVVALTGGRQTRRYSTDNEPLFRQESYFHWMFGVLEGDCHGALDARTGKSTLFVPRLPEEYAIWMGAIETRESFAERYLVDEVMYVDEFEGYLKALDTKIYVLKGVNSDSGDVTDGLGAELEAALGATKIDATDALFNVITELRTVKTAREQEVLKYASKISSMVEAGCGTSRTRRFAPRVKTGQRCITVTLAPRTRRKSKKAI